MRRFAAAVLTAAFIAGLLPIPVLAVADQTITIDPYPGTPRVGAAAYAPVATGGGSGNPVVLSLGAGTTNSACTYDGGAHTYTFVHVGDCDVQADQAGDGGVNYNDAPTAHQVLTIDKGNQTLDWTNAVVGSQAIGATYTPAATSTSGVTPGITVDVASAGVCTLDTGTITFNHAGTCTVYADEAGGVDWNAATQIQQDITVAQTAQTITFTSTAPAAAKVGDTAYHVTATGGGSGNPVTFAIDGASSAVCAIDGSNDVTYSGPGTCTINASQAGDSDHAAGSNSQSFAVGKGTQTVAFTTSAPAAVVDGATYTPTASSGPSGNAVVFTIDATSTLGACSISTGVISFHKVGTCVVNANQAGNATYEDAPQVQQSITINKGGQTVTFTSVAPVGAVVGDSAYTVSATGGASGNSVTFTIDASTTNLACSISGTSVHIDHAGTCVINASQAASADYTAGSAQQSFTIGQGSQAISITSTAPVAAVVDGATYTVTSNGGGASGNSVTFSIDASSAGACTILGAVVSFHHAGTCVVHADQAGDADYAAAPQATQSFSVGKGAQTVTITSSAPGAAVVDGSTYTITATGGASLNDVVFSVNASTTNGACTILGAVVSFAHVGTCVLDAIQAGDTDYNQGSAQQSFSVGQGSQAITFTSTAPVAAQVAGSTYTVTSNGGGASGNSVTFSVDASTTNGACTILGAVVSFAHVGTCVLNANQASSTDYAAAPQVQQTFSVAKGDQTISFTSSAGSPVVGGTDYTVTATASSGGTVTFSLGAGTTSSACTVAGSTVSFVHAGTCEVAADSAASTDWNAAPQATQSFTVGKGTQIVSFTSGAPGAAKVAGAGYTPTVSSTSGLTPTVTVDASASGVCSIGSGTVTFQHVGTCVLDLNQAGDTDWNAAAQVQQSFAVGQGTQSISFSTTPPASPAVGGSGYVPAASATSSLTVTITVDASATSVCSLVSGTVHYLAAGNCVLDANQAGDTDWSAATQVQQSFGIGASAQTITFTSTAPVNAQVAGSTYTVTADGGASGNPVVFTIDASTSPAGACTILGAVVSFAHAGTCVIDANQAGDGNYSAAAQQQQSFTVSPGDQTVSFSTSAPVAAKVGGTGYIPAGTATSGLTTDIHINPSASGVCSISSGTVTFQHVGSCVVDLNQAGDADWNAATEVQQTFSVGQGVQTVSITSTPGTRKVAGTAYTLTATTGSGLAPTFGVGASTPANACSVVGSTVTFLHAGTCEVTADQAGNTDWSAAAQTTQSFTVSKGDQTVAFDTSAPVGAVVADAGYTPTASATSSLAATITVDAGSSAVCSISGGHVTFLTAGSCVLDANQAGNTDWNAAAQVQQTVTVGKGTQTVSFSSLAPVAAVVAGTGYTPTASATSGLTSVITVDASASGVCSISSGTVSFQHVGTCVLNVNQAGNANWNAASQVQQSFSVGKGSQSVSFSTTAPDSRPVQGTAYVPAASATSGLTATIAVDAATTNGACTFDGTSVHFVHAGSCVINATQAGGTDWNAASTVTQTISVTKADQIVAFDTGAPAGAVVGDAGYTPTASATSGLDVVITVDASTAGACTISAGHVTFVHAGSCLLNANQSGDADWNDAVQVQQTVTVGQGSQTVTITSTAPVSPASGDTYVVIATASSGLDPVLSIDPASSAVCHISGSTVTFDAVGACTILADQPGDADWLAATGDSQLVSVGNLAPVCTGASVSVRMSVASSGIADCTDNELDPLTYEVVDSTDAHAATTPAFTGATWSYTSAAGYTGAASFTYRACDAIVCSDPVTVSLTVANAPVTAGTPVPYPAIRATTTTPINVLAAATAGAGDTGQPFWISAVTQGGKGRVTFTASTVTYDPSGCTTGTDYFQYTVTDGLTTATGYVFLTVNKPGAGGLPVTPITDTPSVGMVGNGTLNATVPVKVAWCGVVKAGVALRGYRVDLSTNGGSTYPTALFNTTTATSSIRQLTPGITFRWRALTVDAAGRRSAYVASPTAKARVYQENSTSLAYTGSWGTTANLNASGRSMRWAATGASSVQLTGVMRQFAVVAPKAATYGSFTVWVDGVQVATVSEKATTAAWRRLVYVGTVTAGTHTVTLVPVGNGKVFVDALVTLQ